MSKPRYRCPTCGSTDLWVNVAARANLVQEDGDVATYAEADHEWDDDSLMGCHKCGNAERVRKFNTGENE